LSVEEQSELNADFLVLQRRLGRQQNRDSRSQSQAAGEFAKQLITLSGLTGKSVDEAKADLDAQMRNTRLRAALQAAEAKGVDTIGIQAELMALSSRLPGIANGLQDAFSGANTAAAAEAFATFQAVPGGLQNLIDRFKTGEMAAGEFSSILVQAGRQTRENIGVEQIGAIAGTGAGLDTFASTLVDINLAADLTPEKIAKFRDQIDNLADDTEGMTGRFSQATLNLQDSAVALESAKDIFLGLGDIALPAFSGAVQSATEALNSLSKFIFELNGEEAKGGSTVTVEPDRTRASGGPVTAGEQYLVGEQGPELFTPGASGQITNADITSKLAAINKGHSLIANEDGGPVYGSSPLSPDFQQTFMPGIGNVATYQTGSITKTIVETLNGAIEEYTKMASQGITQEMYSAGGETYQRMSATIGDLQAQTYFIPTGPRSYYDSIMDSVRPQDLTVTQTYSNESIKRDDGSLAQKSPDVSKGMNDVTDKISSRELMNLFSEMKAEMQKIASNTRTGADTSKQLLRATTG